MKNLKHYHIWIIGIGMLLVIGLIILPMTNLYILQSEYKQSDNCSDCYQQTGNNEVEATDNLTGLFLEHFKPVEGPPDYSKYSIGLLVIGMAYVSVATYLFLRRGKRKKD